jgi:glycosyltransferase involved in cell wall biosynthesis
MSEKLLSIIVPVYNEEKIVAQNLPPIFNLPINKEVLVVNDGSTDQSAAALDQLATHYNFRLLNLQPNQGKGAAIKKALEEIKGDYFIVCDADGEYAPSDIMRLLAVIKENPKEKIAVYGSRWLGKNSSGWHYAVNKFLTSLTNLLFSGQLTDMETCFKLIPTSALKEDLRLNGGRFEIEPEISAQLLKAGYEIKEIPISYTKRSWKEGKKIKPRDGFLAILALLKERLRR